MIEKGEKMAKYQSKTIRKAPPHLRNLMKIANDLDTQLNRVRKQIEVQMEIAEEISSTRTTNAILRHQLSERNAPKPTGVDVFLTSGEVELGVPEEELPDFSQPTVTGNKGCPCITWSGIQDEPVQKMGYRDADHYRSTLSHQPHCPN